MLVLSLFSFCPAVIATATSEFSPAPYIYLVHPIGSERGTSRMVTVEGINLEDTPELFFSREGVRAQTLDVEETSNKPHRTPRQRVRIELEVGPQVETGIHGFRLRTRHGTSNWVPFAIGQLRPVDETEPNNSLREAQRIPLPATVDGSLAKSGVADYFRFQVSAGSELVFEVTADRLGSRLDSVLTLKDARGQVLTRNDNSQPGISDSFLAHRFKVSGEYYLRIADRADRGGKNFGYRLTLGRLPYLTQVFPLGTQRGTLVKARRRSQPGGRHRSPVERTSPTGRERHAPDQDRNRFRTNHQYFEDVHWHLPRAAGAGAQR